MPITILRALPELAAIRTPRKHRPVLLRLMAEYRLFLTLQIIGADRHDALDFMRLPLFPRSAIQPNLEVLPLLAHRSHGVKNRVGANTVRTVRIGQVAGHVDLRRFKAL